MKFNVNAKSGAVTSIYVIFYLIKTLIEKGVLTPDEAWKIITDTTHDIANVNATDHKAALEFVENELTKAVEAITN